jgi:hypothetical protein
MSRNFCNVVITLFFVLPESTYAVPATLFHSRAFGQSPPPPSILTWEVGGNALTLTGLQPTIIETPFGLLPTDAQSEWLINRQNASQYGVDFDAWANTLRNPAQWPISRLAVNGNVSEHNVGGPPGVFTLDRLELHIVYPFFTTPDLVNSSTGEVVAEAKGELKFVPEPASTALFVIGVLTLSVIMVFSAARSR